MYFVKYKASPGLPPSLNEENRGYGFTNDPLITVNAKEILKNNKIKRIFNKKCMLALFSNICAEKINYLTQLRLSHRTNKGQSIN